MGQNTIVSTEISSEAVIQAPGALDLAQPEPSLALPALRRRVINLAWPVIGENFMQTLLGITDTVMVARLGPEALAGVGAATQLMFFVISALSATSVGSSVLVAQAYGAHNLARASQLAKQSLVWSLFISIPLVLLGLFAAEPLIAIFGMEPEVTAIGVDYLRVTMGTVFVLTLSLLGGGVLRGVGDSRTPMLISMLANVINVVAVYGLIFGELGMPELGAVGSAWGTFIARAVGLVVLLFVMWRGRHGISIRGASGWLPNFTLARQILQIGIPAAAEQMLNSVAFLSMSIIVAQLGTLALAAHRIAMNTMSLSFLPGMGFALAATALVGQSIGSRRYAEGQAVANIATTWAAIWMSALGLLFFIAPDLVLRIFTDDPVVRSQGASALRAFALTQPFMAISMVQAGALRGTGDSKIPLRVGTTSIWVAVILGGILSYTTGGGLAVIWGAFVVTSPVNAFLLWRRFRSGINRMPAEERE